MACRTVPEPSTIIFALVDNWYKIHVPKPPTRRLGVKAEFSE